MRYLCTCGHFEDAHVRDSASGGERRCTVCVCDWFDWNDDATPADIAAEEARDVPGGAL